MNNCKNCGHEFEGNFCPNCGAKFDEARVCPECGAEVSGNFCANCGHAMDEEVQKSAPAVQRQPERKQTPPFVKSLYAFMPKIFSILFAVFAVLMLICYAGGVQKSELAEEFGGASDSVYSYLSDGEETASEEEFAFSADDMDFEEGGSGASLKAVCAALVAFGVIAVVVAALGLAISFWAPLRAVKMNIGDRTLKLSHIVNAFSIAMLFTIFLLGCILCANAGDELGLSQPGAAPICIIFFSLFFGLLMAAAMFGRKIISYIWGGVKQEYEFEQKQIRESLKEPVAPVAVAKPSSKPEKPCRYDLPDEVVNSVSEDDKKRIAKHVKRREIVVYIVLSPFLAVIGSIIAIIRFAGIKAKDFWRVSQRDSIKAANFFAPFAVVGLIVIFILMYLLAVEFNPVEYKRMEGSKYLEIISKDESIYDRGGYHNGDNSFVLVNLLCMFDRNDYNEGDDFDEFFKKPAKLQPYHLSYKEKKDLDKMLQDTSDASVEKFAKYIMQRQNFCDLYANFDCKNLDDDIRELDILLFFFADSDGLEGAISGYDRNVQPILEAINSLNEYFDLDLTNYDDFNVICDGILGKLEVSFKSDNDMLDENEVKLTLEDYYHSSKIITKAQYAELETKLNAVPNMIVDYAKYVDATFLDDYNDYNSSKYWTSYNRPEVNEIIYKLSYENGEQSTKDALLGIVKENYVGIESYFWNMLIELNNDLMYLLLIVIPFPLGILLYLVLWIFCIKLLKKSNMYTLQLFGTKKVKLKKFSKQEYKAMLDETQKPYKEQCKAYKAYRKAHFDYLIARGYFEEGVPHKL